MNHNLGSLLIVLSAMAFKADGIAQQKLVAQTARFLPGGGVTDPMGKTGFFPGAKGGVEALDLATGNLLWNREGGGRPLLATDKRLFVQDGAILYVLDTGAKGKLVLEAKPIRMPEWVSFNVAYGRSFRSGARLEERSLLLSWEARAFYAGGAPPPPAIEKAARKDASGVVRVDLDTGKIEPLDADTIAAGKFFPMPANEITSKAGELTLIVKDGSAQNPKNPFQKRRTLQAVNAAKELIWEREVAAPIFLPPRP